MYGDASGFLAAEKLIHDAIQASPYYNEETKARECERYTAEALEAMFTEDPCCLEMWYEDGKPVGICITREDDGPIYLCWIITDARYQRRGIAHALLASLRSRYPNRIIWADTHPENKGAIQTLRVSGFRPFAFADNLWRGTDCILWRSDG